ncbi:MAG: DNA polymerase IV [Gammaproteobacteria bacterium]|nr:MAG: DNA polymerase IV [Gammaproteobacteria bacterium]
MSKQVRKIIHIDMDCFFAAIEMRDRDLPSSIPIAVGGLDGRGVVATCNYAARRYGVRSAMPVAHARRLCPSLCVISPDMSKYREESLAIRSIFRRFTELVEPVSLDEAYLDVTGARHCGGSATHIAYQIRYLIWRERRLTASAGVGPNKLIAKLASDWCKPNGQFTVPPQEVSGFVELLPIERLRGVGPVLREKLHQLGIFTAGELRRLPLHELTQRFGKMGVSLYKQAHGMDDRPVHAHRERKQMSHEQTFPMDLTTWSMVEAELQRMAGELLVDIARADRLDQVYQVVIRMRSAHFETRQKMCRTEQFSLDVVMSMAKQLFNECGEAVRLIGVGVIFAKAAGGRIC